ncbi:MAG TPA: heparinase II/III family protein [Stellaceae bacterium]
MSLSTAYYGSALYHLSLWARPPAGLAMAWPRPWPGDAARGAELAAGEFRIAGEIVRHPSPPWDTPTMRPEFSAGLHDFGWLADLLASPGGGGFYTAGEWTRDWLDQCDAWTATAWRAEVLADRLVAWTQHFAAIARDDEFRARLLQSYGRQARHLGRVAGRAAPGLPRLGALRGLVIAWTALDHAGRRRRALARFLREVETQFLPDGGHVERSPRAQFQALRYLIDAREGLRAADLEVPDPLRSAIDRAAPMLRFFRHGDNKFALFNGANEDDPLAIEQVLNRAEAKGRAPVSAPYLGFQRLQAGRSLVIIDAGAPPGPGLDRDAHAGTLSFEMSHGKDRLIVNCGAYHGPSLDWRATARATAAHSTLIVADTNSSQIWPEAGIGRRPNNVVCERAEDQGSQWVEASHDGYVAAFGLTHARQLFLSADGEDLRGEERLTGPAGQGFCLRFHLHPAVQVSLIQDGAAALLRLPGGVGWRLRAQGAVLSIAESIYLGSESFRKSRQLVLDGHVGSGGALVKWALRREQKKPVEAPADDGNGE